MSDAADRYSGQTRPGNDVGDPQQSATVSAWALRGSLLALIWLLIAGGDPSSLLIGVPSVLLATWGSLQLAPPVRIRWYPLAGVRFAFYFLGESVRGGVDVAARTLLPRMRIQPGYVEYSSRLPQGLPQVLVANCVSLLPGTLTVHMDGPVLKLHVLDTSVVQDHQLRELEQHIAAMFGIDWEPADA